jgi:hypothetical protein
MLVADLRLDARRAHLEPPHQVKPETQAVEVRSGTKNAIVPRYANPIGRLIITSAAPSRSKQ